VNDATSRFEKVLRKNEIQPNEIDKIIDLVDNYDPLEAQYCAR